MTRDQLVETMAWAMSEMAELAIGSVPQGKLYDTFAAAVLTAIEAAGMRVVPVNPSEAMIDAGDKISKWTPAEVIYRAMLAAQEDSTSE